MTDTVDQAQELEERERQHAIAQVRARLAASKPPPPPKSEEDEGV
jgi:hypothetical protein